MATRTGLTAQGATGSVPARPDLAALVVVSVLGIYTVVDSAVLRVAAGQRVLYATIALVVVCAVLLAAQRLRMPRFAAGILVAWMSLLLLWLVPAIGGERVYPGYVAGDLASMGMPALFLLAAYAIPDAFRGRWYQGLLAAWLVLAMIAGMLLGTGWGGRFEPPHNLLVVLLWLGVFAGQRLTRAISVLMLMLVLVLAFQSGARTAVVLWFVGFLYLLALRWPIRRLAVAAIPLIAVITLFAGAALQQAAVDALSESRFRQNIEGEADVSLISRLNEAQDVIALVQKAPVFNVIVGHGHGATFRPERSMPVHNLTAHGLVHHVHITPVMLLYRYGLIGVILYLWLAVVLARSFFRERKQCLSTGEIPDTAIFTFALVLFMADSLLRNPLVDPLLSWVVAGFIASLAGSGDARRQTGYKHVSTGGNTGPSGAAVAGS
jgi:hypothetical protein